jgi:hypothetical protein
MYLEFLRKDIYKIPGLKNIVFAYKKLTGAYLQSGYVTSLPEQTNSYF